MPEDKRPAKFLNLIERTGLDPELEHEVEVKTSGMAKHGLGIYLRRGQTVDIPGFGRVRYVRERMRSTPVMQLPDGVRTSGFWLVPKHALGLAPAPATADEYWRRADALEAAVDKLGGRLRFLPEGTNGWLSVAEKMASVLIKAMGGEDRVSVDGKSKYGTWRVSVDTDCRDETTAEYIAHVAAWAETATERLCQIFGTEGWNGSLVPDSGGWVYTLSDRARALSAAEVRRLIYPRRPEEPGDE